MLSCVLEIEVEVGQESQASIGQGFDIPDDHGACRILVEIRRFNWREWVTYLRIVFPEPAMNSRTLVAAKTDGNDILRFP